MYSLPIGMTFITLYAVLRSARLIGRLFNEKVLIDIFDQTSLYVISRYSAWTIIIIAIPSYLQFILLPSYVEITVPFVTITFISWLLVLIVFWLPLRELIAN